MKGGKGNGVAANPKKGGARSERRTIFSINIQKEKRFEDTLGKGMAIGGNRFKALNRVVKKKVPDSQSSIWESYRKKLTMNSGGGRKVRGREERRDEQKASGNAFLSNTMPSLEPISKNKSRRPAT